MRQSIRLSNMFRPAFVGRPQASGTSSAGALRAPAEPVVWLRSLSLGVAGVTAVLGPGPRDLPRQRASNARRAHFPGADGGGCPGRRNAVWHRRSGVGHQGGGN